MSKCAQKHADLTTSVHEPLRKPEASVCPNPSDVRKRAEWAFMNDRDPDNRIEARRDGALARLRPAHGRVLRPGRGPVQRADSPARVSSHARPVRARGRAELLSLVRLRWWRRTTGHVHRRMSVAKVHM